jgi:molecular chaperone DnaJ
MAKTINHYQTLNVNPSATQAEIKRAYRQLVKRFHPDVNQERDTHEQISHINAAYEILGDPQQRYSYDRHLAWYSDHGNANFSTQSPRSQTSWSSQQERVAKAQQHYQRQRQTADAADQQLKHWIKHVYNPVNQLLRQILGALDSEMRYLSADPFDDELMADFQDYLEDCHQWLSQAQGYFSSSPNPNSLAGVAASLYYCLNHVGDGLEELETFTLNYDDHYLHMGKELFRLANKLRREAHIALQSIPIA